MTQSGKLDKIFIILAIIFGSLILIFPVQNLLLAFLCLIITVFFLAKPIYCYYLTILLSTVVLPIIVGPQQLPFNQTDILITLCTLFVLFRIVFLDQRVCLKTKIDIWLAILLVIYCYSGLTSASHRGYQGFLRFGEIIAFFYLTVYFIRIKDITIAKLIRFMLFIGIFQSILGIAQSLTGWDAGYYSNRGYLGYFGLGSSLVWHGKGTFNDFNSYGAFLSTLLVFFLPIYHYIVKNKKAARIIIFILFSGVIVSYTRNALVAVMIGFVLLLFQAEKNKIKFIARLAPIASIILMTAMYLKNTSYVSTLSSREQIWPYTIAIITDNFHNFFLGVGINAYDDTVLIFQTQESFWKNPHNFYLKYWLEMGVIGLVLLMIFLISVLIKSYKDSKKGQKLIRTLNISNFIIIISVLYLGIYDITFNYFHMQLLLFLIFGMIYSKDNSFMRKNMLQKISEKG